LQYRRQFARQRAVRKAVANLESCGQLGKPQAVGIAVAN
jgi:hypothetical protein